MDTLFYFVLVEQMIANVALAAVIMVFGRAITRALYANTEPCVGVNVVGNLNACKLMVSNYSACEIAAVRVEVSEVNALESCELNRLALCTALWDTIAAGSSVESETLAVGADRLSLAALSGTGPEVVAHCSFVRRADNRPFSCAYRIELHEQADGSVIFTTALAMRGSRRSDAGRSRLRMRTDSPLVAATPHPLSSSIAARANLSLEECIG